MLPRVVNSHCEMERGATLTIWKFIKKKCLSKKSALKPIKCIVQMVFSRQKRLNKTAIHFN